MSTPDPTAVRTYLMDLQDRICGAFEAREPEARFSEERFEGPGDTLARPRVIAGGRFLEKSAVHFTNAHGPKLPPAATERRPELAGASFEAVSLSLITHPLNPYVPTSHMNLRCFVASPENGSEPVWWFGGGFDLTPVYGFEEDAVHWHECARRACETLGPDAYARFKKWCDEYFFLPHRQEARGVGGVFFDDLEGRDDRAEGAFEHVFAFVRACGDAYLDAYLPIVDRRLEHPWGEREKDYQRYRRGRYAEFNLVYDRGTKYGMQSGRRIESVLASLPPEVHWRYDWKPEPGSPEAELVERYLVPREWVRG